MWIEKYHIKKGKKERKVPHIWLHTSPFTSLKGISVKYFVLITVVLSLPSLQSLQEASFRPFSLPGKKNNTKLLETAFTISIISP